MSSISMVRFGEAEDITYIVFAQGIVIEYRFVGCLLKLPLGFCGKRKEKVDQD